MAAILRHRDSSRPAPAVRLQATATVALGLAACAALAVGRLVLPRSG